MTVALGTNIANPISTALSQWLGFDTMGKLANYGKLGVTDPDAVIQALFASGEQGAWYDPSDLTTMFQDRAGTTPVTADGQTVGKILDKSGRGNHATAPSDAARPLYKTDGTYHWIKPDGVDDSLSTAAINFNSTDKATSWFGAAGLSALSMIFTTGDNPFITAGSFGAYAGLNVSGDVGLAMRGSSGTQLAGYIPPVTGKIAATLQYDLAGGSLGEKLKVSVDTVSQTVTAYSGSLTEGTFGNLPLTIGIRPDGSAFPFNGEIYSIIILGRLATTQEITDTETWVNGKTGAY